MKCLLCEKKLSVRSIVRICKESDEHIYCKECFQKHVDEQKETGEVNCPQCQSIVWRKNDDTFQKESFENQFIRTFIVASTIRNLI